MPEHRPDPDDALARLRAADPAAGLEPDRAALDAAVRARLAGDGDELADRRAARSARRPGRWAAVAAVAVGALVAGPAGYALGDRSGADTPAAAAAAISLPGSAGAPEAAADSSARLVTELGAGVRAAGPGVAASMLPWYGGRTVFTASGLSDEPTTARAWAFDASAVYGAQTAARVAAALGVEGEPRLEGGTWAVGASDGSGPGLQLQPDGVASVSFYDPTRDPYACAPTAAAPDASSSSAAVEPAPGMPECTTGAAGEALAGDAAVARARDVVAAVGADADAFEYEPAEAGVPGATFVTAYGVVEGQRTGVTWSLTLVGDAVQSLYGALAPLVPLGEYDVVGQVEAVERLGDPRFGSTGGPVLARAAGDDVVGGDAVAGPATEPAPAGPAPDAVPAVPPAVPAPGTPVAWPVTEVTLTGARLGLAQHTQPDGATLLVPAYELTADDGAAWSVLAVAGSGLDLAAGQ